MAAKTKRLIGPAGSIARLASGVGLIGLAAWAAVRGDLQIHEVVVGVVGLPALVMLTVFLVKRVLGTSAYLNATGSSGHITNFGIVAALLIIPWTREIAFLFYGIPMFLAAWRGYPGCEMMAISNFVLRRQDELGCAWFWPIDTLESRLANIGRATLE